MKHYLAELMPSEFSKERKRQTKARATGSEMNYFRSLVGEMVWL